MTQNKDNHATIYDVADRVGVSLATVSRVINGIDNVRPETKARVEKAIEELGYHPNAIARGLASSKTTTVGVMFPKLTSSFYTELAQGIVDVATMYNYDVLIVMAGTDENSEVEAFSKLLQKQVDGVVYMANSISDALLKVIQKSNVPVVLAASLDNKMKLPSVNVDHKLAYQQTAQKMLDHKRKKIALINSIGGKGKIAELRREGYESVVKKSHEITIEGDYEWGYDLGEQLLSEKYDAALIVSDIAAAGAMNYLSDHGAKIPEDFEIIAGSDSTVANLTRPALSTIRQPKYDIGAVAMRALTKLMNNESLQEEHIYLPFELVKRGSTSE